MRPQHGTPRVDHQSTARALRANPATELLVGDYRNSITATNTASAIRNACGTNIGLHYKPRGAFETRTVQTADSTQVWARYVGGEQP